MSERPTVVDPSPRRAAAQAAVEVRPADGATLRQQDAPDDPELTQLLGVVARLSGKDAGTSPDLRRALRDLGRLYYRRGEYAEAEPFLERALALAQRVRLPDASEVVDIENDLGWVRFSRRSI